MEVIKDKIKRKIACSKRKKGIIKKAMELSILCNQKIFMIIYDQDKQKTVQYCSHSTFNVQQVTSILQGNKLQKAHTNEDYFDKFAPNFYKDQGNLSDTQSDNDLKSQDGDGDQVSEFSKISKNKRVRK